jgi:D-glycero-alpha-D-manno-heptose 1-phosphate guanylyltransferase
MPQRRITDEAIVLAGGFGTRLQGVIGELPKPMAAVAGRPFLEWQLDALALRGIRHVVLSVGFRREAIEEHFGESYRGIDLDYAREAEPLGTGGAIAAAMRLVRGETVFVLNGDTFIRAPLGALDAVEGCRLCLLVARVDDAARFGTVVVANGHVQAFLEKGRSGPGLVNCGVYRLDRTLIAGAALPEKFSFERDFVERSIGRIPIGAVVTDEPFIDIGIPSSLAAAHTGIPALAARDLDAFR